MKIYILLAMILMMGCSNSNLLIINQLSTTTEEEPPSGLGIGGLVLEYLFTDNESVAVDTSGNENNGTITGATWTTSGYNGAGFDFDGSGDYISTYEELNIPEFSEITLSTWVKFQDYTDTQMILTVLHSGSDDIRLMTESNYLRWNLDCGSNQIIQYPINSSHNGKWVHIAGVFNGTVQTLYINGSYYDSASGRTCNFLTANGTTNVGRRYNTGSFIFLGTIDQVRIYNRSLSATEILQIYNYDSS